METGGRRRRSFPDAIVVEIISRLPLRIIARFKLVSKQWRSLIESSYFRSLFVSLHRNSSSSSSWSLMFPMKFQNPITEAIGFHGCKRWDLPKSPASYLIPFQLYPNHPPLDYYYISSSNGLVWVEVFFGFDENHNVNAKSFVGNPVTKEWVEIHQPIDPSTIHNSLVTRVVNGVVSSFKLINTSYEVNDRNDVRSMYVYSSETGAWSFKRLHSPCPLQRAGFNKPLILDGTVYVWDKRLDDDDDTSPGVLVAYDFFAEEDDNQCRIIPLPGLYNKFVRRCLTTSGGDVIYVEILDRRLKVWKLKSDNSDGEWWQLTREEINMASVGFDFDCFPMGINPFDTDLVYLWSRQHSCVVSGNLRTQKFTLRQETETWSDGEGSWRINTSDSKKYMEEVHELDTTLVITLSQFVLPQWMDPVPRPPY
ncbi:hypothetical protein Bca4012_064050 [Brassica carinata]|uniref:F-box domain-containing protein n=1 Tax=Brassica carinata TaxID=52824 RepID=A0A8X7SEC0_BRACI|nr:hypothetical protein Bca52824_033443 [Brassica carinata]